MTQTKKLAVIFFSKGDADDGGVKSILALLKFALPKERLVLTNYNYLATEPERYLHLAPSTQLRTKQKRSATAKLKLIVELLMANVATFKLLAKEKPEVIICNDFWSFWHIWISCLLLRIQVFLFVRDTPSAGSNFSAAWLVPFALSTKVISLSEELRKIVRSSPGVKIFAEKLFRTEFVVVPSLVTSIEADLSAPDENYFSLGYVASFRKKKRQLEFIKQVVPLLIEQIPNLKVTFLGGASPFDSDYRDLCQNEACRLGIDSMIEFVDHVDDPTPFYRSFHLTALASTNEGLARTMLESLAAATPVVSFNVCSAVEVLENHHCGIVVDQGDFKGLSNAIISLSNDRKRLQQMRINSLDCIRIRYSQDVVKKRIGELL